MMCSSAYRMRDISGKEESLRSAEAAGFIEISEKALDALASGASPKGDVLALAETAALIAVKKVPILIPMCHNIPISYCAVSSEIKDNGVIVRAVVKARASTGVEMEALTAVSVALLNIYDMLKPVDKELEIKYVRLLKKSGGKSGDYEYSG